MPKKATLREIVARKRRDVARGLDGVSLQSLRSYACPTKRSLKAALEQAGARFIMEVKRASPSSGKLSPDVDAGVQALAYEGAADAISVLTDDHFFKGSLDDLSKVRSVFDGPILAKDFIVDVRQVVEARIHGADAVLVMLSVLSPQEARIMIHEAKLFGMDVLVEVHDSQELQQAIDLGCPLIGINNRNLKTFEVDLRVTERLAPRAPKDRIIVAESGISGREDVDRLAPQVDAFLIGSALMRSPNPAQMAREFAYGRVKVCGLTSEEDAIAAADSGATHAGMIFVPETPRAVETPTGQGIAATAQERGLATAGVFRDACVAQVAETARSLALDVIQLHGQEDEDYIGNLRTSLPDHTEIWAASSVGRQPPRRRPSADRTLFDTEIDGRSGGTGRTFDWKQLDRPLVEDSVLAGGLNPANARAASRTGAWALDVCSGVETVPGKKDPDKMLKFFASLRPTSRKVLEPCK